LSSGPSGARFEIRENEKYVESKDELKLEEKEETMMVYVSR
jgi:hypothetical protein